MYDLPAYVWTLVLIAVVGIPAATVIALYRGGIAAGLSRGATTSVAAVAAILFAGFLVASALLANAGAYARSSPRDIPWVAIGGTGLVLLFLLLTRNPFVSRLLAEPGMPARLALPHTFRILGAVFLLVMFLDKLPAAFAIPAALGDMAVAVSAPFVARQLANGTGRTRAIWFNILGIVDFIVAFTLGILLSGPIAVTPTTEAVTYLPLALIPSVAVPVAITLHIVSLLRLRSAGQAANEPASGLTPLRATG